MLEYNLEDAEELLSRNLSAATKSLATVDEDLGFLRDQTTTTEVSILEPNVVTCLKVLGKFYAVRVAMRSYIK